MAKIHCKNGFEYTHEKYLFAYWVYSWKFRPIGKEIWIVYSLPLGKVKKIDIERLLDSPLDAIALYEDSVKRQSDIAAAEQNLEIAKRQLAKVEDPNWGGRGNNPDKDSKTISHARDQLVSAKNRLETAIAYTEILKRSK
ncbi:hypothetical protein J8Z82_20940 [Yersinia enterocolitica]|uniref:hypothetical protein n=1 Tax=Yersinia enterocolitica TaxID=630 RepID=UPI001C8D4A5B|nr:hypothetical protein [Yersinia enterocolitica]MBX9489978.1 hypothetical protein [Yersinia enterocolitica]MBX9494197.1 hypothetical protein [Yersinia enterocolitica]